MRARNLKPAIFKNEELAKLGPWHVLLFEGLWCLADRKGRLEDRPERIEAEIFPFKFQKVKVDSMLNDLSNCPEQFIIRYEKKGCRYIQVVNFLYHNYPHIREADSTIPAPDKHSARTSQDRLNPESPILNPESPMPIGALRKLDHELPQERREYRIPEPKETPVAAVVMYFKAVKKGIPYDDRTWDKRHWPRSAKAASDLLQICGSYETARACLDQVSQDMGEKSWTLETIVRWAHEWKAKQGGKDYGATNSARFFDAVAKQRTASKLTDLRAVSTVGEILDGVRNLQGLPHSSREADRGATRVADARPLAGIREEAVEAKTNRGEES